MKGNSIFFKIILVLLLFVCHQEVKSQADGDYRTVKSVGNWNDADMWQVRTAGTWAITATAPGTSNSIYIQSGHTLTINTASAICNDLHIATTSGNTGNLVIGTNILQVNGKLRGYTQTGATIDATDGQIPGTNNAPSTALIITTSGTGKMQFVGNTRNITNSGEWAGNITGWNAEFALNAGQTGTLSTSFKAGNITIASGIVRMSTTVNLQLDGGSSGTGTLTINNGSTLQMQQGVIARSATVTATSHCASIVVNVGGTLEYINATVSANAIGASSVSFLGNVSYSLATSSTNQNFITKGGHTNGTDPFTYTNLLIGGGANCTKTSPANATIIVNGKLTMNGTSGSSSLVIGSGGSLQYGTGATLEYNSGGTMTVGSEWPAVNGPTNITLLSSANFTTAGSFNRTVSGVFTLNGGSFSTNTAAGTPNILTIANGATLVKLKANSFNIGNGTYIYGNTATDVINVQIGSGSATPVAINSTVELAANPTALMNFNIFPGFNYAFTSSTASTKNINNLNLNGNITDDYAQTRVLQVKGNITGSGSSAAKIRMMGNTVSSGISGISFANLELNDADGFVLTGSPTVNGTLELNTGALAIGSNTLNLNGPITGSGTLSSTAASNLVLGGAGTLNFTIASHSLNNLTLNTGSNASLGTALDVYGTITLTTASLDLNAQNLTLKSNASGTARIADLTGSTLTGATNVTMERWIKLRAGGDGRAYRLLAPTVNTTGSIQANWMEGAINTAIGTNVNPVPNFGTQITGAGGNANGFDVTQSNASSLYATTNAVAPTYTAIGNTGGTLNALTGYFLYIRGDRSMNMQLPLAPNMPTSSTTLRTTGMVVQGTQTAFTNPYTGGGALNLVTNPYPSPINWSLVRAASSGITGFYTLWDPNFGTRGGFVTVSTAGVASSGAATQYIQPGQAFFVESDGGLPAVSIQETHKASVNNNEVFLTPPPPVEAFRTELYITEPNAYRRVVDGVIALFDNNYSKAVDSQDAREINNWDENIAIARDGKYLAIEGRPVIMLKDTLPLFMNNMKQQAYEFEFTPALFSDPNLKAELIDNFLNTRTLLSVVNTTVVSFTVTADAASKASDRFKVVFGPFGGPLAVDVLTIKANQKNNGVQVEWTSKTETDMAGYEVARAGYGSDFTKLNTTTAIGNSPAPVSYNWFDADPNPGTNFYRVKAFDKTGNVKYSDIVKVTFGKGEPGIAVYPNPVKGKSFKMDLNNMVKGTYLLNLYNNMGQLVYTEQLQHDGSQATKTIDLETDIAKGVYRLQLSSDNGFKTTQTLFKN